MLRPRFNSTSSIANFRPTSAYAVSELGKVLLMAKSELVSLGSCRQALPDTSHDLCQSLCPLTPTEMSLHHKVRQRKPKCDNEEPKASKSPAWATTGGCQPGRLRASLLAGPGEYIYIYGFRV